MSGERSVAQDQLTFSIQVLLLKPQQEVILVVPFSLAVPLICLQEQLQRIRSSGMVSMDVCIVWTLLPILREVLPSTYLNHLAKLVVAIHLFSSQSISKQNLRLGRCLLHEFHAEFSDLYGTHIHCLWLNS